MNTFVKRHGVRVVKEYTRPSRYKESMPPKTLTQLLSLLLQLSPSHLLCLPLDLDSQFYLKQISKCSEGDVMAPAWDHAVLRLDEPVAWPRNSSLRRMQKVATHLSKPFPLRAHSSVLRRNLSPSKGTSLSGQTSQDGMWLDALANACLCASLHRWHINEHRPQGSPRYTCGYEDHKLESGPVSTTEKNRR